MASSPNRAMGAAEWLLLILLSLLWGGTFFLNKVALADLQPFTIVLGRVALAALVLHVVVRASGLRMPGDRRKWSAFFAMGALNNLIPFSLIVWGQIQIASGLASILNATTPLFTVLFAHFLTRDERMTVNRLGGILLGLGGVAILVGPEAIRGLGLNVAAQLACLAAAVSYALAGIFGRRFRELPPMITATGQLTASTAMVLPVALIVDRPWMVPAVSLQTWGAIVGIALLSTAVAYTVYFRLLAGAGATNALLVTFLLPVIALVLGTAFLGEQLDPRHFLGMGLIGGGLAAVDGRLLRLLKNGGQPPAELAAQRNARVGGPVHEGPGPPVTRD